MTKATVYKLMILLLSLNCLKIVENEVLRWQKVWKSQSINLVTLGVIVLLPNFLKQPIHKDNEPTGDPEPVRFIKLRLPTLLFQDLFLGKLDSASLIGFNLIKVEIFSDCNIVSHTRPVWFGYCLI